MAVRPLDHTSCALVLKYTVQAAGTVTKGMCVKLGTVETDVLSASTNEKAIGIALESGVAGDIVNIAMLGCGGIVPVLIGTGGSTHGEHAICTTNGVTNQTLGGGTTVKYIVGTFLETCVVGDYGAMVLNGRFASGAA